MSLDNLIKEVRARAEKATKKPLTREWFEKEGNRFVYKACGWHSEGGFSIRCFVQSIVNYFPVESKHEDIDTLLAIVERQQKTLKDLYRYGGMDGSGIIDDCLAAVDEMAGK